MEDAVSGLMKSANKLSAYRANAVSSATPENLVVMMYDGAIRFLGAAIRAFEHEDPLSHAGPGSNQRLRFPNSPNLWLECQRLAVEGAELAPACWFTFYFCPVYLFGPPRAWWYPRWQWQ